MKKSYWLLAIGIVVVVAGLFLHWYAMVATFVVGAIVGYTFSSKKEKR